MCRVLELIDRIPTFPDDSQVVGSVNPRQIGKEPAIQDDFDGPNMMHQRV